MRRSIAIAGLIVSACLAPTGSRAQEVGSSRAEGDDEGHRLRWPYAPVQPTEYALTFGLPVSLRILDHNLGEASEPVWRGTTFIDDAAESLLGNNSESVRSTADLLSDLTWYASMLYPYVDAIAVALLSDRNPYVAWQMIALNTEALAMNGFVTLLAIRAVPRRRPDTRQCLEDGGRECDGDMRSFPSGHTSGSFTGAGLSCAHHTALELYGSRAADAGACAGALVLASSTAVLRVIGDRHQALDVLTGAGIGLFFGWAMPWLLHYSVHEPDHVGQDDRSAADEAPPVVLGPAGDLRSSFGLSAAGFF